MAITKNSIQPISNIVVAEQLNSATKTPSGLYLPDSTKKKTAYATVVAVGPDVSEVKVGEKILYKMFAQHEVQDTDFILVEEPDILAKVVEE